MPVELNELFFGFLKILFVVAGGLYVVFAVVAVKQIHTMKQSLVTSISSQLRVLGFVHLAAAISVLLFFIVSL